MIDEIFVESAIRIKKEYFGLHQNMESYKKKASDVVKNLNYLIKEIETIQEKAEKKEINSAEEALNQLLKVLDEVESEGKRLEITMKPINERLEKLSIEEQELWRNIKLKHDNLPDDDIVNYVKDRLEKENLL
jgi:hypothetical protein